MHRISFSYILLGVILHIDNYLIISLLRAQGSDWKW